MSESSRNSIKNAWSSIFDQRIGDANDDATAAGFTNREHYAARAAEIKQRLTECFSGCIIETLLDIGCNRGHFATELSALASRTIGLDIASAAAKYCKENERYTDQIEADGLKLPFATDSIDACVLLDSLTSSENAEELVREACRTLRPEGIVFIETLRHCGWIVETLRCLRATWRDLASGSVSLTTIKSSLKRSFRPSLDTAKIKRPSTRRLLATLRTAGIKKLNIREHRCYGVFPGERVIIFGQKGVSGNAKNASLR